MHRTKLPRGLAEVVEHQDGVMSRTQAMEHGLSRMQVGLLTGQGWQRLLRGVYSCEGDGWRQRAWAGVLAAGRQASVGGVAAARLHGLRTSEVGVIDIWTPRASCVQRQEPGWRFRRGTRSAIGSPPRTSLEETVLDLCAGAEADDQAGWVTRALSTRRTTARRLRLALEGAPRIEGRADLLVLLNWLDLGLESPLEVRYLRDVERRHGLPVGVRQQSVSERTRTDVHYDQWSTLVELDGQLGHRGEHETRDAWRDARHLARGLATLRFGWTDLVQRPCGVASMVASVLRNRGWSGFMRTCPRCDPGDL